MTPPIVHPLTSLPPVLLASLKEATDQRLQVVIGAIIASQYASSSPDLADFRSVIKDKDVKEDPGVLSDFRNLVPVTNYDVYRPWVAKFFERPCKLSEVENLLAPGLPSYFAVSSSTSGSKPKYFARYFGPTGLVRHSEDSVGSSALTGTAALMYTLSYRDIVDVTTASGEIVKTIPVSIASSGSLRIFEGWTVETDNTRMASMSECPFDQILQWMVMDTCCSSIS